MMTFRTDEPLGRAATATRLDAALMRCVTMLSVDQTMCKGDTRALTGTTRDRACGGGGGAALGGVGLGPGEPAGPTQGHPEMLCPQHTVCEQAGLGARPRDSGTPLRPGNLEDGVGEAPRGRAAGGCVESEACCLAS